MKRLFTFLALLLYFSGAFAQVDTIPKLIISEWRGDNWGTAYMELTNVGDTALDLSDFMLFSSPPIGTQTILLNANSQVRLSGNLEPGASWISMPITEGLDNAGGKTYRELMEPLADLLVYKGEGSVSAAGLYDSISTYERLFRLWGGYFSGIYYNYPSGDSLLIDAVNNSYNDANGGIGGINSEVAGIPEATTTHILVRKANVTTGNTNWEQAKGISIDDSEWLPIPEEQIGGSNPQHFTTVKVHGDYHIDLTSSVIDINWVDTVLTVPWGIMKYDSIMDEFAIGPNMSWHYLEHGMVEDSAHVICQTGDVLQVYGLGNTLELMEFDIVVVEPTDDLVLAFPLEHMNENPGSWGTRYEVTENVPVMDSIVSVPFAERVDTLFAHLEIAANATSEIVWVDGIERADLKYGDILKVTGGDGTSVKEYFISVEEYVKNDNALLASITWPDMPGFISDDWMGDTIPGFSPTSRNFNIVLPYGMVNVPALVAKSQDVNAVVDVDRAISLGGGFEERTTTFTVTAESDTTVEVYKVTFVVEKDYSNVQPYSAEPFFSEMVARIKASGCAIEIVNSGNTPLFLDNYMIVQSDLAKNAADAITQWGSDSDNDYVNRFGKYVPGYKYTKDTAEWRANPEFLIPDANVDPYVAPGDVFVMWKSHNKIGKLAPHWEEADIITAPHISECDDPLHPATNPWDEIPSNINNATEIYLDNHFLFKIVGDSILEGLKGLSDPDDFELIDVFGDPVNTFWTIGGTAFEGNTGKDLDVIAKPYVDAGRQLVGDGFGTDFTDTDWMYRSAKNIPNADGETFSSNDLSDNLGFHEMDPITKFMSTVSSLVYKVSPGFSDKESIRGVVDATTVDAFIANIILSDPDQTIVLKGAAVKTGTDALLNGDTLVVTSKDLTNTTKYVLEVTANGLNNNATLTPAAGSAYVIDITGETGTVSGIAYGTTISDALAGVEVPVDAVLNVIDSEGNLLPMQVLNADTVLVATNVSTDVFFEVIAENGTTIITYNLVPTSLASDAFVVSDLYAVDQTTMAISIIPGGTAVMTFLSNITPVAGATMVLKDKAGFERTMGNIAFDDKLYVTSEDASVTVSYYLTFIMEMYPDAANVAPIVSITVSSFDIAPGTTISLEATATDDGNPAPSTITYLWEVVSGDAGTVSLATADQLVSDATFSSVGNFDVQLSVSDGDLTGTGTITVSVVGVGVEDMNAAYVRAYPNPATEMLNIELGNNTGKNANIRIVDITGQVIYLEDHTADMVKLDLAKFKSGIYFMTVTMEENSFVNKIQIVK